MALGTTRAESLFCPRFLLSAMSCLFTHTLSLGVENGGTRKTILPVQLATSRMDNLTRLIRTFFLSFFFHLTYSRWTSLPSCLWSQRIFPSLPGSRLTIFYRDASSALLQLVNQWLNFSYSRSHAFRYERKNTNPTLARIELTTSVLADVQLTY